MEESKLVEKDAIESVEATLPWTEKYRPNTLDELIAHTHIISTINRLIDENKLPHLLFYGPPGTGKTSTILACAKRIYGSKVNMMCLKLNASDDRGIDVVRNRIVDFAGTKMLFSNAVKLIILDEADAMSKDAQFALRRVIEKYAKSTRFCLVCNYVSKIIPALQSRCTRFRFAPLEESQIMDRLNAVATKESLKSTPEGMKAIMRISNGDMRKVLNVLQATSMGHDIIDEDAVYLTTGEPQPKHVEKIAELCFNAEFDVAFKEVRRMQAIHGFALSDLIRDLSKLISSMELPPDVMCTLIAQLSDIEYRLSFSVNEKIQLGAMIGCITEATAKLDG